MLRVKNDIEKRIKIVFIQGGFRLGGGERQILYFLKYIDRKKIEPYLITYTNEGPLFTEVPKDIEVFNLEEKTRNKLIQLWCLFNILKSISPQFVYCNLAGTSIPLAIIRIFTKPFWVNTKFVISVVNNVNYYKPMHKKLAYLLYKYFDYVLACSTGIYEQLKNEMNLRPRKLGILFNAVDTDFIDKRGKDKVNHQWFSTDIPLIITVASLIPQKSMHDLINAFVLVRKKINSRLIIIGDGVERPKLEKLVSNLDLKSYVDILGYQVNSNRFVAKANVFLLTSKYEGLATVLLEAAIVKTPIVCTNAPYGSADVVKDKSMGIIVEVGNVKGVAQGIIKMLIDKKYAKNCSDNLYNRIVAEFSVQNVVAKFERIISSL